MKEEIRKLLVDILTYIGADKSHADNAQLQTYVEWFIERHK